MIIEIGYSYQSDNHSPVQESWTYFYVKGVDLEKAKKKARTYWNKFIKELGWTKKAKLIHIEEIRNAKTKTPNFIVVSSSELPGRRRPSTSSLESRKPSSSPRKRSSNKKA